MLLETGPRGFEGPLDARDKQAVAELGRVLRAHGFPGEAVPAALGGPVASEKFHLRQDLPVYLRRLADPTPINTLIKLFVLDQWVDDHAARAALDPLGLDDVRNMGLIECGPQGVHALVRLSGYCDLVLAHDRYDRQKPTLNHDHVLDVNPTTVTLANLMVRRPARRALDVGTGCGVLALLAARFAQEVVAVDTNPRALNLASFNARLNGVDHVEYRQGSLFDPVRDCRFDLIVCNPPYVISPESRYIFRDGGRRGDAFCEEVVRRAPEHLEEGGFASILCNWGIAAGESWSAPPGRWVEHSGCDSWLVYSATQDPLTYAALWNRGHDDPEYDDALERWTAYCEGLGIASIGLGAVILRRRTTSRPWVRTDHIHESPVSPADLYIQRLFEAQDLLSACPDDSTLLARAFRTGDDHHLHQTLALRAGEYVVERAEVQLDGCLPIRGGVDAYTIHLLARCNGARTLGEIAAELAEKGGRPPDQIAAACAAIARRLLSSGFLVPAACPEAGSTAPDHSALDVVRT